jgi:hypothetical protein
VGARAAAILAILLFAFPPTLEARQEETSTRRTYRSAFGPTDQDELRPPALTFTMSLYGGLDDNTRFATGNVQDDGLQSGRSHQGVLAAFRAVRRRSRTLLTFDAASAVRYYPSLRGIGTQKHSGAVSLSATASRRVRWQLGQTVSYSPSYQLALGTQPAGEDTSPLMAEPTVDYSVSREKQLSYGTSADVNIAGLLGGEIGLGETFRLVDFFTQPDFLTHRSHVSYTRPLAAGIGLRLGYGLATARLDGESRTSHHDLDVGLNYDRQFLFSPRATLAFTTGAAIVNSAGGRHIPLTGNVQLQNRWSPRWTSGVSYQRGIQSIDSVSEPFLAGILSGTVNGYLTNALRLSIAPSYSRGAMVGATSTAYSSWTTETRVDVTLSHHWAFYAEHFFYHYRFNASAALPDFLATRLQRHGVRAGVALWAPVIR